MSYGHLAMDVRKRLPSGCRLNPATPSVDAGRPRARASSPRRSLHRSRRVATPRPRPWCFERCRRPARRPWCVAKRIAELLGWFLLALANLAAIDHAGYRHRSPASLETAIRVPARIFAPMSLRDHLRIVLRKNFVGTYLWYRTIPIRGTRC